MRKKHLIRIIILILCFILMIISTINIIDWLNENNKSKNIVNEEEKNIIVKDGKKRLDEKIKKDNKNTIGWLIVDGTNINYPVLKYSDNNYYLTHDFNNDENSAGWIFMDYQNTLNDQNIIIYGHHRRDGSMFGSIDNLFNTTKKDLNITLITNNEVIKYKIFSIYRVSSNDSYNNRYFKDFSKTIDRFAGRSNINFNQNYHDAKSIITLSTCSNNNIDRIVVHGYR